MNKVKIITATSNVGLEKHINLFIEKEINLIDIKYNVTTGSSNLIFYSALIHYIV